MGFGRHEETKSNTYATSYKHISLKGKQAELARSIEGQTGKFETVAHHRGAANHQSGAGKKSGRVNCRGVLTWR
jgi:hypothetical protein